MISNGADVRRRRREVYQRHPRKVGVDYFVHFCIWANLEKLRKLVLDFHQGTLRRDFKHERRVAKQCTS